MLLHSFEAIQHLDATGALRITDMLFDKAMDKLNFGLGGNFKLYRATLQRLSNVPYSSYT